ncbi:MAG TPA: hypothetical protein VE944_32940 [Nostoc sp.]|uniref:hypothetical protein n=1 Tax=Nostoc sp. TaxID=1180 RepID=UPI002D2219D7|nr:hypothetical protein [Nostoc sp.]HYX19076.1 hypothetical protein [Nostoc sp.]
MPILIPGGGSFQNVSQPWLTPQVLVDINLEDIERISNFTQPGDTLLVGTVSYDRVINAEIQLIYIAESEIDSQLDKVLQSIATALTSDWNPSNRDSRPSLSSVDPAINPMNFQYGLQIDSTQEIRYISVWIQSQKLKIEYATQAFQRVKTYVLAALSS